ncbi:hypothetical protein BDC45DRAFT_535606 [Circinella umbellata]|nr:hypothetical protein BDC45DRAFT_535606 [Circinella umbellata]
MNENKCNLACFSILLATVPLCVIDTDLYLSNDYVLGVIMIRLLKKCWNVVSPTTLVRKEKDSSSLAPIKMNKRKGMYVHTAFWYIISKVLKRTFLVGLLAKNKNNSKLAATIAIMATEEAINKIRIAYTITNIDSMQVAIMQFAFILFS